VCSRCAGYGHTCTWSDGASREYPSTLPIPQVENSRESFSKYQHLVRDLSSTLPDNIRLDVANSLTTIATHLEAALQSSEAAEDLASLSPYTTASSSPALARSLIIHPRAQRYLGEVSDLHFFNIVKQTFNRDFVSNDVNGYDHEEPNPSNYPDDVFMDMPSHGVVENYLKTYFTTIHIAYPFICETTFLRRYKSLRLSGITSDQDPSWLALLCRFSTYYTTPLQMLTFSDAVLAIGSYYVSFPGESSSAELHLHKKWFQLSVSLSKFDKLERSLTQVSSLLAQCFYLLGNSRTDRCWITLGLSIRLGQSIGLHVITDETQVVFLGPQLWPETAEIRSRVWYSLYVLDRMLALQMGRPAAISDSDCHVLLPSRLNKLVEEEDGGNLASDLVDKPSIGDYFLRVIDFSSIVGRVLKELYSPLRDIAGKMQSTDKFDKQLLSWKYALPRFLRFDVGHALEKSVTFRRQVSKSNER
jgi:hypothetical protein